MPLSTPRFAGDSTLNACLAGTHRMQQGEPDHAAVQKIQRALVDLGYLKSYGTGTIDGIYGPLTDAAVAKYKDQRNIRPSDGVVGPQTMARLDTEFPTRAQDTGVFAALVATNRIDADIADLLNEFQGFPASSFALQMSNFALQELNNNNLVGIVRAANAANLLGQVEPGNRQELNAIVAAGGTIPFNAESPRINDAGRLRGFTIVSNDLLNESAPGHEMHAFAQLVLVHELTHFRNRVIGTQLFNETIVAAQYVDLATAQALQAAAVAAGNPNQFTTNTRRLYVEENACRHVAWNVWRDIVLKTSLVIQTNLATGQLFHSAFDFAKDGVSPSGAYFDNTYMSQLLASSPTDFNRQVGIWFDTVRSLDFIDDATKNQDVKDTIAGDVAAFQPQFNTPAVDPDGEI
jgi:peptidoglycan hydrolase-like protein with peptidoglycan-binding domain